MRDGTQRSTTTIGKRIVLITGALVILGGGLVILLRQTTPSAPREQTLSFPSGTKLTMVSELEGWAFEPNGGKPKILFTSTNGQQWLDRTPNDLGGEAIVAYPSSPAVWFADEWRAYVALALKSTTANGAIDYQKFLFKTADSGETWTRLTLYTGDNYDVPISLFFQDNKQGWLITEYNANGGDSPETKKVFRTNDGGQTWTMVAKLTN